MVFAAVAEVPAVVCHGFSILKLRAFTPALSGISNSRLEWYVLPLVSTLESVAHMSLSE